MSSCDCVPLPLPRARLDRTVPLRCLMKMKVSLPFQDTETTVSTGKIVAKRKGRPLLRVCQTGSRKLKYCFLGCGGNFVLLLKYHKKKVADILPGGHGISRYCRIAFLRPHWYNRTSTLENPISEDGMLRPSALPNHTSDTNSLLAFHPMPAGRCQACDASGLKRAQ